MITREEFVKTIDIIKEYYDKEEKLTEYLHEFFMDGHSIVNFGNELIHKITELLAKSISEEHWETIVNNIEHFICEVILGGNPFIVRIDKDTIIKDYYLDSSSTLYDYVMDYLED